MKIKLGGKWWEFRYASFRRTATACEGYCHSPETTGKKCVVRPAGNDEQTLYLTLHEMLHALAWIGSESWVVSAAAGIRAELSRLGYRLDRRRSKAAVSQPQRGLTSRIYGVLCVHTPWMDKQYRRQCARELAVGLSKLGWHRPRKRTPGEPA